MKCTRQRCHGALNTWAIAAFRPSCASEMTSLMPARPRLCRSREAEPEGGSLGRAEPEPDDLAPSVLVDRGGDYRRDRDHPTAVADLEVGGVEPQIGPFALDASAEEGTDPLVDLLAQLGDLALRDAAHPHRLHQIVDLAGRDALDPRLLHDGGQCRLRRLARLPESRKVAALAQ